ncbi:MAG: response regulator [Chloroflexota bacterium]
MNNVTPTTPKYEHVSYLVVDDNETNRMLLMYVLKGEGCVIEFAENGQEALDKLRQKNFDVVLLDLMMPEVNGYEVLRQMKADKSLRHIPAIVVSALDNMDSIVTCIQMGAEDYLTKPFSPVLLKARVDACLEKKRLRDMQVQSMMQLEKEKKRVDDLLQVVIPIGVALSAEKDFNRLLEKILLEAKMLCHADAGTLYLQTDDNQLRFVIMRNDSLKIALGGTTGEPIPFPPLNLYDDKGTPNHHNVATYAALSGATVNIPDAYQTQDFDFSGTHVFDKRTGYRSTSFLTIPLKDGANQVIGVLQLLNAMDADTGKVIPFDLGFHQVIESMATLATVALKAYIREEGLRAQIEKLKIEVDEAKKSREVAEITETDYFQQLQEKVRKLRGQG